MSIGTNSTRLLVVRDEDVLTAESTGTRLGSGLGPSGRLDRDACARTLRVVEDYVATVRARGALLDVIATSALRRADDAAEFQTAVQTLTGIAPRVLSGDEEASYSFRGATRALAAGGRVGVLDAGGGSTELAVGTRGNVERTVSLEVGAVRLSERHPPLLGTRALSGAERAAVIAGARADARAILTPLAAFAGTFEQLIAVGGTMFTAAAMIARDAARDNVAVDGAQRRRLIDELTARDLAARRAMAHIRPQRADILPAGLIVVDEACSLLGIDGLRVSHADLLAGYLHSRAYRGRAPAPGTCGTEG